MSRRTRILLLTVLLVLGGLGAWAYFAHAAQGTRGLTLYGNVDIREVELAFRVPGRLAELSVDEGDLVHAGQVLGRLDPLPLRDALAAAEARAGQARANLERLKRGSRSQEIAQARARVSEAAAAARQTESDLARQSALAAGGAASGKVLEAARALRDEAQARLASEREALALAIEGSRREDVTAGAALLASADAEAAQSRTQLADTELIAPSDGMVLARAREPGSMLAAGAAVLTLSLRNPVYVRAYVSEQNLGRSRSGARVIVRTDSSARDYHGQVGFVSPRAEFTPKSVETTDLRTDLVYRLRIVVADADEALRQGMPVTVVLPDEPQHGAER